MPVCGFGASGERRRVRGVSAREGAFSRKTRSIAQRNAESVLPEPVGATTSALRPADIACHALAEHAAIRQLVAALPQRGAGGLEEFAVLMNAHVRFEERQLFAALEKLLPA